MKRNSWKVLFFVLLVLVLGIGVSIPVVAATTLEQPKLTSVAQIGDSNKIRIKWKKVKNAKKYDLYVSIQNSSFKKLATTKKLSYVHKGLTNRYTYKYKVRAVSGKKKSKFSKIKSDWIQMGYTPSSPSDSTPTPAPSSTPTPTPAPNPTPTPTPAPNPTPTPTPAPNPTPTPTPTPSVQKTTWDYYIQLKNSIIKTGSLNKNYDSMIKKTYDSIYDACVVYERSKDDFVFVWTCDSKNTAITMYVNENKIKNKVLNPEVVFVSGYTGFSATGQCYIPTYNGTDIYFIPDMVSNVPNDLIQGYSNASFKMAMLLWSRLVYETTGITIRNLGFTNCTY